MMIEVSTVEYGMENNIGEKLNKAYEAYRQVSIEKDHAQKELKKKTDHFERYTQKLQNEIEEQKQVIKELKAQLSSSNKASGEVKSESSSRKQEVQMLSPCYHRLDNPPNSSFTRNSSLNMETAVNIPHTLPAASGIENKDVVGVFQDIRGQFLQIQTLTRRQKDHLGRMYRGKDVANDQQFSIPIQCTDVTAETPLSSALRSEGHRQPPPASLASRGASHQDRDLENSLDKLSVKFPPCTDSEYEFLNSTPEKHIDLAMQTKGVASSFPSVTEEASPFPYRVSPQHFTSTSPSASLSPEGVRGPQQLHWSPRLCDMAEQMLRVDQSQSTSPDNCAYCNAVVPQDHMQSHLYSHCMKNEASNCH